MSKPTKEYEDLNLQLTINALQEMIKGLSAHKFRIDKLTGSSVAYRSYPIRMTHDDLTQAQECLLRATRRIEKLKEETRQTSIVETYVADNLKLSPSQQSLVDKMKAGATMTWIMAEGIYLEQGSMLERVHFGTFKALTREQVITTQDKGERRVYKLKRVGRD